MGFVRNFVNEFKEFISRGSVLDMAVGVIVGGAFKSIIDSLVADIIMPVISQLFGGLDFSEWFLPLNGGSYPTLAAAKEVGAATLNYGSFITVVINFLLMSLVIFCLVKVMNTISKTLKAPVEESAPTTKTCPYCKSEISIEASRCPHCTSQLTE